MKTFFHFDSEESRIKLLSRARNVALTAIRQFDLDWNSIRFIQLSDTITYKIDTDSSKSYLLRIHSERMNKEEIYSELMFLNELKNTRGLTVPVGIKNPKGTYVLECKTEEGYQQPNVTLMSWIDGEHFSDKVTDSLVYNMGVMMGRLHDASTQIKVPDTFIRPHWGIDSFNNDIRKLKRYYPRFLTREAWELYRSAIAKIVQQLENMPRNTQNYGLIHADLHSGNVVINDGHPYPIDFGRCGYGYFLYDMAGSLLELSSDQRKIFIQGYETIRKLETDFINKLECFFIMFMIENYCHHSSNPNEINNLKDEQKYALAYIKEYISNNTFLFKRIVPIENDEVRDI